MVSVSGIRGVVGENFNPDTIIQFVAAYGSWLGGGPVVVGRDSRVTGEMVENLVVGTLQSVGCDVIKIGIVPTPTVQLAIENLKAKGGIAITASHNPIQWNALKLMNEQGMFLDAEEGQEVIARSKEGVFAWKTWQEVGKVYAYDRAIGDHMKAVLELPFIDVPAIRQRKFKVAIDCVNGAGAVFLPDFLHALGCEIVGLNTAPNGLFPHTPEPLPQNLTVLSNTIRANQLDIGFAVDPDSDRCAIFSETGDPLVEEYTLALAVNFILSKKRGPVVTNLSTTLAIDKLAEKYGVPVYRTKVGEIHVAKKMKEVQAVIGGEGNGGVILPEVHLGRDAPVAIALTLQQLVEFGGTISELHKSLPQFKMVKKKIQIGEMDPDEILNLMKERHKNENLNTEDGLKIISENRWVHLRKSNTEPIIRVYSEAPTAEEAETLADGIVEEIQAIEIA